MYSKSKNIMIVVLLILLATLSLYVIGGNIELQNYQNQIAKFSLKEQAYLEQIDDKGNRLVEQEQIIMSQDQAISSGLLERN